MSDIREPTREDRRKIKDELEVAYDVDKQGYFKGHCDQSVAERLDVPRKWVVDVREAFYGPPVDLSSLEAIAKLTPILEQVEAIMRDHLDLATRAETMKLEIQAFMKGTSRIVQGSLLSPEGATATHEHIITSDAPRPTTRFLQIHGNRKKHKATVDWLYDQMLGKGLFRSQVLQDMLKKNGTH